MSNYEEALGYFATYAGLVTLKMMILGPMTSFYRKKDDVYVSEEDYALFATKKDKRPVTNHPQIERLLRCSRNDHENIIPFIILGGLFACFSGSPLATIIWHYRIFVGARFFHTVAYLLPLPQPCRALAYFVGFGTNLSMAIRLLNNNWFL